MEAWRAAGVAPLIASLEEAFWSSLIDGSFRRETGWRRAFATLWTIWLHKNKVIFRGVAPSGDAIQHAARGGVLFLEQRWLRPLTPCTPVTIDLYPYIILSMTLGGNSSGVSLPHLKKKDICITSSQYTYYKSFLAHGLEPSIYILITSHCTLFYIRPKIFPKRNLLDVI